MFLTCRIAHNIPLHTFSWSSWESQGRGTPGLSSRGPSLGEKLVYSPWRDMDDSPGNAFPLFPKRFLHPCKGNKGTTWSVCSSRITEWDNPATAATTSLAQTPELSSHLDLNHTDFPQSSKPFTPSVCVHAQLLQLVLSLCDPMNCSHQSSLSMEFLRQEYWNGLSCPPPCDLPYRGLKF